MGPPLPPLGGNFTLFEGPSQAGKKTFYFVPFWEKTQLLPPRKKPQPPPLLVWGVA